MQTSIGGPKIIHMTELKQILLKSDTLVDCISETHLTDNIDKFENNIGGYSAIINPTKQDLSNVA